MKRVGKPVFFIVALLVLVFSWTAIFGVHTMNGDNRSTIIKGAGDIRWGIDINGGVEATFKPDTDKKATTEQMQAAKSIIEVRLTSKHITDYELFTDDSHDRIIVRFPWKNGEASFDPETAIQELSATAKLTFREGEEFATQEIDENGAPIYRTPAGATAESVILTGADVKSASAGLQEDQTKGQQYVVNLEFSDEGKEKFAEATTRLVASGGTISIWMDDIRVSAATVNSAITEGKCFIEGNFSAQTASELAQKIQAGALPFKLNTVGFSTISPTLGATSLNTMSVAGVIAMLLVCLFMLVMFRVPGLVACISLMGQAALCFAAVSGYFPFINSFTMTLPGISGIILSIGMGVDANIITATRIKEELWAGKTLDGAIANGEESSFSAIFDGNVTTIIVSLILMGVFGPSNILSMLFGASVTGSIYSFGYTLLIGNIGNFIFGVGTTRLMTKSLSGMKFLRHKWLFGGPGEKKALGGAKL